MFLSSRLRAAAFALAALAWPRGDASAADPAKEACFNAYEQVQLLRKAGKLRAAEALLPKCTASTCPAFAVKDCARWSQEIEAQLPTAIFVARDGQGHDLVDVEVSVDGESVLGRLDGRPVPLDPGARAVRFQWKGQVVEQSIVVAAGQKNRRVDAVFDSPASGETKAAPADAPTVRKIPTASLVLGGIGVAATASFAVFGIIGKGKESCAPTCTRDEVDSLRTSYTISDVSLVVAVVALGAAVAFWALDRPRAAPTAIRW